MIFMQWCIGEKMFKKIILINILASFFVSCSSSSPVVNTDKKINVQIHKVEEIKEETEKKKKIKKISKIEVKEETIEVAKKQS